MGMQLAGITPSAPINLSLPPNVTVHANSPFKGKSFDVEEPLNATVLDIIQAAVQANGKGWVQFSAYGVSIFLA